MEKVKEFISNPKNGAIFGIIGCSIMLIFNCFILISDFNMFGRSNPVIIRIVYNCMYIGFLIYFISILLRLKGKKIKIESIKIVVIIGIIISGAITGINFIRGKVEYHTMYTIIVNILPLIGYITTLLYTITIFKIKNINLSVNNKVFLIGYLIGFILPSLIFIGSIIQYGITNVYGEFIYIIGMSLLVPYLYNYYNLMKGEK